MARPTPLTGITPELPLRTAARYVVRARTQDLATWARYADNPAAVAELHNLRIAAKRLRYSLELLLPALPPEAGGILERVQKLQELLGTIHDDDVLLARLQRHLPIEAMRAARDQAHTIVQAHGSLTPKASQPPMMRGLYGLLATVSRRRQESYGSFAAWWATQENLLDQLLELAASD